MGSVDPQMQKLGMHLMQQQLASKPKTAPKSELEGILGGLTGVLQGLPGMMQANPGLFGMGGPSMTGPAAISPAAAMTAYGNMPKSYTMPGFGGG